MVNEKDYEWKVSAAGRVNIIGEHVDYCGGKVFPAALGMRNTVYLQRHEQNQLELDDVARQSKFGYRQTRLLP